MDHVEFTSASGSFKIADDYIYSDDSILSSHLINIYLKGRIGFNQSLDIQIITRFTPSLINETHALGGFAPAILNIAETKITQYRVTGSLNDPRTTAITS